MNSYNSAYFTLQCAILNNLIYVVIVVVIIMIVIIIMFLFHKTTRKYATEYEIQIC